VSVDLPTWTKVLVWLATGLPLALAMEPWSAFVHGRVWHGPLWSVHRSHHRRQHGSFEFNDVLAVSHAPPAMAMILYGCVGAPGLLREALFGAGLGMTAFGLCYIVVHDGLIHGRLPVSALGRLQYFQRIVEAHEQHHRSGALPYGLFRGPAELARAGEQR
jgi:beta-carotene 3-hydroxylase